MSIWIPYRAQLRLQGALVRIKTLLDNITLHEPCYCEFVNLCNRITSIYFYVHHAYQINHYLIYLIDCNC